MRIGVPKEIKTHEYRVGMTPGGVREAVQHGHAVQVETGAGIGISLDDAAYEKAGAIIAASADEVFAQADLIVKVKEPQPVECARLQSGQTLFTYLHLAPDPQQAQGLLASGCMAIAYETVTDAHGRLPLLAPMSEVAGRMAIQAGAHCLEKSQGGSGTLLGGVPGVCLLYTSRRVNSTMTIVFNPTRHFIRGLAHGATQTRCRYWQRLFDLGCRRQSGRLCPARGQRQQQ